MPPITVYCYVVALMFTIRSLAAVGENWGGFFFIIALIVAIFGYWTDQRK